MGENGGGAHSVANGRFGEGSGTRREAEEASRAGPGLGRSLGRVVKVERKPQDMEDDDGDDGFRKSIASTSVPESFTIHAWLCARTHSRML